MTVISMSVVAWDPGTWPPAFQCGQPRLIDVVAHLHLEVTQHNYIHMQQLGKKLRIPQSLSW